MSGIPDHPVIRNCERTGWPDGKEPSQPICPVCGQECERVYADSHSNIVGCDACLTDGEAATFRHMWESNGTGWPTERLDFTPDGERIVIRAYYGSSTYNTKQMSRLIDAIVTDCKELGIETLPPDELRRMGVI